MKPKFFVALAHTDTIACFNYPASEQKTRVSCLNLFPNTLKENLLFSMSFDSSIHYDSMSSSLDPVGDTRQLEKENRLPKRIFADCGAFQFRDLPRPMLGGVELDHEIAWEYYEKKHILSDHIWDEILLCSPDHIVTSDMDDAQAKNRFDFIAENAGLFLEKSKSNSRVYAVGVIHGRNVKERIEQYEMFKSLGYEYVALGGMVPYSTKQKQVLGIVAGIKDIEKPVIDSSSILGMCRKDGIRLHIFGLNSPEWVRWWHRLQIDSFDGSKLSTEGAANGWYYVANNGRGKGRDKPEKPTNVGDLYQRIAVKEMKADIWEWSIKNGIKIPIVPLTEKGVDTSCHCPACKYLKSSRCTSERCWYRKIDSNNRHVADPRMMGSTEHNMGRVAHNAYIFSWLIEMIEIFNNLADNTKITDENSWLGNWKTIEVEH